MTKSGDLMKPPTHFDTNNPAQRSWQSARLLIGQSRARAARMTCFCEKFDDFFNLGLTGIRTRVESPCRKTG